MSASIPALGSMTLMAGMAGGGRVARSGRAPAATAMALLGTGGGDLDGVDVRRLKVFLDPGAGSSAGSIQGPTTAELVQYHKALAAPLPPMPAQSLWEPTRLRRHLRRRQVQRDLPTQQQEGPLKEDTEQQQAAAAHPQQSASAAELQQQLGLETEQVLAAAAGAVADVTHGLQQAQKAVLSGGAEAAGLARQQLAALQHLTAQQLANLQEVALWARQGLVAASSGQPQATAAEAQQRTSARQPAIMASPHRAQAPALLLPQQATAAAQFEVALQAVRKRQAAVAAALDKQHAVAATAVGEQQAAVRAAVQDYVAVLQHQVQQALHTLSHLSAEQLASLKQTAKQLQSQVPHIQQAVQQAPKQQLQVAPLLVPWQQAAQQQRQVAHVVAPSSPPVGPMPAWAAAAPNLLAQWAYMVVLVAAATALMLLRWLRVRRRRARVTAQAIREAEQQAHAARVYDRTRQRFYRALQSAEELEDANSSVFVTGGRKGQQAAAPVDGDGSNLFLWAAAGVGEQGLNGAAAAAEDEEDGSPDAFDPASWDAETRKQWDAFVSRSKVNKGQLWDTNQVDQGLPEVWVDLNRE